MAEENKNTKNTNNKKGGQSQSAQATSGSPPEEHHYELNILAWVIVVILAATLVWFFLLDGNFDFRGSSGISEEVLAQRMAIAEGRLGEEPFENIANAFFLESFPLPSDDSGAAINNIVVDPDTPEYDIAQLEYISNERMADIKEIYMSWSEQEGYDTSQRNSVTDGSIVLDVVNGEDSVATISIFPFGRSFTQVSIFFPIFENPET